MTIQQYIEKHGLKLWRTWPTQPNVRGAWTPSFFVTRQVSGKTEDFPNNDKIEIYSNPELTLFVALNLTQGLFRIVHHELISMAGEWQPMRTNYNLQPVV
jgi:hypothetical protein